MRQCRDSFDARLLAAGAGLDAVRRLDDGEGDVAFYAVRPPVITPRLRTRWASASIEQRAAVTAAALADPARSVAIVDYDAHHGNGTQDVFYPDDRVLYVVMHQYPSTPAPAPARDRRGGGAPETPSTFPYPKAPRVTSTASPSTSSSPGLEACAPTWLLISAGSTPTTVTRSPG